MVLLQINVCVLLFLSGPGPHVPVPANEKIPWDFVRSADPGVVADSILTGEFFEYCPDLSGMTGPVAVNFICNTADWVLAALLLGLLGWWGYHAALQHQQWTRLLNRIEAEPGVVITSIREEAGNTVFLGLRDPLAVDPQVLLEETGHAQETVTFRLEPFLALTPEMIYRRALLILQPPETVSVSLEGSQLILAGHGSHAWISAVRERSLRIPGIVSVNMERLIDTDLERFETVRHMLEEESLNFFPGQMTLQEHELAKIEQIKQTVQQLDDMAKILEIRPSIHVIGYSSPEGSESTNTALSALRAKYVWQLLDPLGLRMISLEAIGRGVDPAALASSPKEGQSYDSSRRVYFEVERLPVSGERGGE